VNLQIDAGALLGSLFAVDADDEPILKCDEALEPWRSHLTVRRLPEDVAASEYPPVRLIDELVELHAEVAKGADEGLDHVASPGVPGVHRSARSRHGQPDNVRVHESNNVVSISAADGPEQRVDTPEVCPD
jgi:hypothetical protein